MQWKILIGSSLFVAMGVDVSATCDRPVHVQLLQVQDFTASFADDSKHMPQFIKELEDSFKDDNVSVEFAMTAFRDKAQVGVGYGNTNGIWSLTGVNPNQEEDFCYNRVQSMSKTFDNNNFKMYQFGGGKDDMENQYDALYRSVADPKVGWAKGNELVTEDGKVIIKFALLVTDAPAHRDSPNEDFKPSRRNWHYEESYRGPCAYKDDKCTEKHGDASSKTGTIRSMKGVLSHYNNFRLKHDVENYSGMDYVSNEYKTDLEAYRFCCTEMWYSSRSYKSRGTAPWVAPEIDCDNTDFPGYKQCAQYSCKMCGTGKCEPKWHSECHEADFISATEISDLKITDYPYEKIDVDMSNEDCSNMEYPDPFDERYYSVFTDNNVVPLIMARVGGPDPVFPLPGGFMSPEYSFLSGHVCPELEYDPVKFQNCQNAERFKNYSNPSIGRDDGISKYGGCDKFADWGKEWKTNKYLDGWYKKCWAIEYGTPVKHWQDNGVPQANLTIVDADIKTEALITAMKKTIMQALQDNPNCRSTTPTPVPVPPISGSVTTTKASTTTTTASTTKVPSTKAPTTKAPTTKAPTTKASTTKVPSTKAPTTKAPTTKAPTTKAPTTENDSTESQSTTDSEESTTGASGGSSKAVVIGSAAGGAAAVVGGVAGLMAKGVIPGFTPSSPVSTHVEQVNVQSNVAEREQLTQIDASMFV